MSDLGSRLCAGSAAGFAATGPMTVLMEAAGRLLPPREQDPLPPRQITENAADQADVEDDMSEGEKANATMALHFAYGASTGAAYGLIAPHVRLNPVARGIGYALGVWGASYLGLLPTAGLYHSAADEPPGRNAVMLAAHVVWGAVLGTVEHELSGRSRTDARG